MKQSYLTWCCCLVLLFSAFLLLRAFPHSFPDGSQTAQAIDAEAVAMNNRGVALMGQFNYEEARKVFAQLAEKYPKHPQIQINLAIAVLNRQKEGDEPHALEILSNVLKEHPDNVNALYCTSLLQLHRGNAEDALKGFQKVAETLPNDPEVSYFIGQTLMQQTRYADALPYFHAAVAKDQYISSAYYGMIMCLRQQGKMEEAGNMIRQFQKLRDNPRSRLMEFKYTKMGRPAEAQTLGAAETVAASPPQGPLFNAAAPLPLTAEAAQLTFIKHTPNTPAPTLSFCDIDHDGDTDIFVTGATGKGKKPRNILFRFRGATRDYVPEPDFPLCAVADVNAVLWGDIDGDGRNDAYLCRNGENQLWLQPEPGKWQNMTVSSLSGGGDADTVDGVLLDADHDGDLDIFLINKNKANELFSNNRDGTFRPLAAQYGLQGGDAPSRAVVVADLDGDADADILVIDENPPHQAYRNQRLWQYEAFAGFETFNGAAISACAAADIDGDGQVELYTLGPDQAVTRWLPDHQGQWRPALLSAAPKPLKHRLPLAPALHFADLDGSGQADLLVSGPHGVWTDAFHSPQPRRTFDFAHHELKGVNALGLLVTEQGPALMGLRGAKPPYIWTPGNGRHGFALLRFSGRKGADSNWRSNSSGIGTRVAVRIGSQWSVFDTYRNHSGPGQSVQPLPVGLGGAPHIDFIAMDWSDGVYQTETIIKAGENRLIHETQRQLSSCPVLFAWNGEKYEFVSDLLGVGGIGYAVAPGEYAPPRPWEFFMMPEGSLKPQQGRLKLKLTEPMEEACYLDSARLAVYDLPPGWRMTMDERMGILGPQPTGEPVYYRRFQEPQQAVNDRGQDVASALSRRDLKAAPVGPVDHRFIGLLEHEHVLMLRFPHPIKQANDRPVLAADGWVEYPYSQTNFAAWQADRTYNAPSIDYKTPSGEWKTLLDQFGYPAGMPRQMSVPLDNLPQDVTEIRIRTNQEVYWDCIFIAYREECRQVIKRNLEPVKAIMAETGFPQRTDLPQRLPYYDYDQRAPLWDTRFLEGFYTRFGDVLELVARKDNALAIFGAGEEVHLEFRAPAAPAPEGYTRVYVLETNGWCKDMDLYTNTPDTLAPIPASATPHPNTGPLHDKHNIRFRSGKQ